MRSLLDALNGERLFLGFAVISVLALMVLW